tara:strand:+ start:166 stop:633 length:468 start_codon:yes stop_codon:yes gene_type:complete
MKWFNFNQRRKRVLLAGTAGILLLFCAYHLTGENQRPLSAMEKQLVGEWCSEPGVPTRIYKPDRKFTTSTREYTGFWHIDEGELTVTVWQPYEFPRSLSFTGLSQSLESIQRSFNKEIYTFQIEIVESGQQHIVNHPIDKRHPDGKWLWTRKTDR